MFPFQFGKYLLTEKIAQGGMAEIFLAKLHGAEGFEKEVVIKRILPQWAASKEFLRMLIDEAKLAVLLNHSNIVQIYELGKEGEDHFIAMEYVPGIDLRRLWERANAAIPLGVSLTIMIQALEGLSYAHTKKNASGENLKIVHRDVSPQNILISWDGAVKLTDFGIAKAVIRSTETLSGVHKGKFSYMSPEQANLADVGQASDIFSATIVLYELVTGRRLFGGTSDIETLDRIRRSEIRFTSEEKKTIPERLRGILLKGLSRSPEARFPNAASFREALSQFARENGLSLKREELARFLEGLGEQSEMPHDQTRPLPTFSSKKSRRILAIPAGIAIILAAFLSWGLLKKEKPQRPAQATAPAAPTIPPIHATKEGIGFVSVLVLPWGHVSIDGGEKRMSPIKKIPLKEGPHQVTAYYEPEGVALNTPLTLKSGLHLRCIANFEKPRSLACR